MLSLTDMWKAAGRPAEKRPADWLSQIATKEFVGYVEATLDAGASGIQSSRGGRGVGGNTWAHWQIAFAYAKYLSPEFHAWCNTVVRDHIEREREAREPLQAPEFTADAFTLASAGACISATLIRLHSGNFASSASTKSGAIGRASPLVIARQAPDPLRGFP